MITKIFVLVATSTLCCFCTYTASADPNTLYFEDFLLQSTKESPQVAEIDASFSEKLSDALTTELKLNPNIEVQVKPPLNASKTTTEYSAVVSVPLRRTDFGIRKIISSLIRESGDVEKQLSLNEFTQNIKLLYIRLWEIQERLKIVTEAFKRAEKIQLKVKEGAKKGLYSEGDLDLFQAEIAMLQAESIEIGTEQYRTFNEATQYAAVEVSTKKFAKIQNTSSLNVQALITLAQNNTLPIQKRYALLSKIAAKELERSRLDATPPLSPQFGFSRINDGTNQMVVGLSIPLPFYNRNQAETVKAEGALKASEKKRSFISSSILTQQINFLTQAIKRTEEEISLYNKSVIPFRKRALLSYQEQFERGTSNIMQIWQIQRELLQSQKKEIELITSLIKSRTELSILTGEDI